MVVLHKGNFFANSDFKLRLVKAFKKETTVVPKNLELQQVTSGMARGWLSSEYFFLEHAQQVLAVAVFSEGCASCSSWAASIHFCR